ncbi:hypothetical protein KCP78_14455 [Salmonella enterica subsp. enterica]|nr:hypothetical protein KCP78_14455 [Salmonella enterica subsp. enterica]
MRRKPKKWPRFASVARWRAIRCAWRFPRSGIRHLSAEWPFGSACEYLLRRGLILKMRKPCQTQCLRRRWRPVRHQAGVAERRGWGIDSRGCNDWSAGKESDQGFTAQTTRLQDESIPRIFPTVIGISL